MAIQRPDGTSFLTFGGSRRNMSLHGLLYVPTAAVATPASLVETNLFSYTLPAKSLNNNGKGIHIRAVYTTSANGNTKRVRLYFGATVIFDSGANADNAKNCAIIIDLIRTAKSVQAAVALAAVGTSTVGALTGSITASAPVENTSNAIVIRMTGLNGTATAGDIVGQSMIVQSITEGQMTG